MIPPFNFKTKNELDKYTQIGFRLILTLLILYILVILTLGIITLWGYINLKTSEQSNLLNIVATTGTLGDTLGGIFGPIIAIIASLLTYWAFMVQVEANQQQRKQFKKQFVDQQKGAFESRFFELLKIHKENASLINNSFPNSNGFNYIFYEFKFTYLKYMELIYLQNWTIYRQELKNITSNELEQEITRVIQIIKILLFGVSKRALLNRTATDIKEYYYGKLFGSLETIKGLHFTQNCIVTFEPESQIDDFIDIRNYESKYTFMGHFIKLNPYILQLKILIDYVYNQPEKILGNKNKQEYYEIVRAQLSKEELFLLYYLYISKYFDISEEVLLKSKLFFDLRYEEVDFGLNPILYFGMKLKPSQSINDYFRNRG